MRNSENGKNGGKLSTKRENEYTTKPCASTRRKHRALFMDDRALAKAVLGASACAADYDDVLLRQRF